MAAFPLLPSLFFLLQEYKLLFEGAGGNPGDKTLEDRFFEHEVSRWEHAALCDEEGSPPTSTPTGLW